MAKPRNTNTSTNKRSADQLDSDTDNRPAKIRDKGKQKEIVTDPPTIPNDQPVEEDNSERPTVQRVKFDLVGEDDEDSDQSSSANNDLRTLHHNNEDDDGQPVGFLTAKNPSDAYFLAHGKINPTSTNLFSARPNRDRPLSVSDYLDSFNPQPLKSAESSWKQWTAELIEGYSILFYGLGSKRVTLNEFVERHLVGSLGWEALVINAFQAGCDLSSLLNDLEEIIDDATDDEEEEDDERPTRYPTRGKTSSLETLESRAQRLSVRLVQKNSNLPTCVLMIHNLDGMGFRNPRVQTILGLLTSQPRIHLIATIDHINAPILLASHLSSARPSVKDPSTVLETFPSSYNFLYHHLSTPTPYILESLLSGTVSTILPSTIFPPTMINMNSSKSEFISNGAPTAKATLHVLSSLTEKAKALFRLLAEHQICRHQALPPTESSRIDEELTSLGPQDEQCRAPLIAISGTALFELARTEFVASAITQMQALLVEFRDHNIILAGLPPINVTPLTDTPLHHSFSTEDDQEWLWIGLSQNDLHDVLSKLDDL
ncbi:hypothetical protein Pst134EA_000652 [Puccinia striiformis f. sp. tritici]|uniref:hypothetical protein n=1 Tax=Puccinia striiformis f. sp. tritici TaxID=168172 RepID=UPI0020073B9F|nr:hypothetical protein Pst134EA_000652 [Puccinia striiformis f. sp. tritici]KAH9473573.1 hypothetical protein Pst134EA_000652 [Puccinia striiformis f. sp. tritici]KAI9601137.1 hypothetical protein H4Q26_000941 [Puccinia striiformis f. sp. tritici PST-130]